MDARRCGRVRGFTLIELLVVLSIIGMGMFVLLPRLDFTNAEDLSDGGKLNALAGNARLTAMRGYETQRLVFTLGSPVIAWTDQEIELSASVAKAVVNGQEQQDLERSVKIYSDGHMDECRIELSSGDTLHCSPLSGTFTYGKS